MQFYRKGQLPVEVAEMTLGAADGYSIAWTFMGYSFAYILFVGILQIIGAGMLLWNRTKFIGTFILLPILVNIIVFDLIFLDKKGAVVNATIYFLMLIGVLWINRKIILVAIQLILNSMSKKNLSFKTITIVFMIMIIVFVVDQICVGMIGR
ncbi:MAG: hypothetical protein WBG46_07475 [Nonlabens sp.]